MSLAIQNLVKICGGFGRNRSGSTLPMVAVGLVVSMGAGAIGVDLVQAHAMRQSLSLAADAAVLVPSDVVFGNWDAYAKTFTPSPNQGQGTSANSVKVTTRLASSNGNAFSNSLAHVIGFDILDISVSAIAGRGRVPCVLTLNPSSSKSARIKSNGDVQTIDCGFQVNSTTSHALTMDGNSNLSSSDVCVGGTVQGAGSSNVSPQPREFCPGRPDPLASTPMPAFGACNHHDEEFEATVQTISPGVYCGGLAIDDGSHITLPPGLYVIKDGELAVDGGSTLSGSGVTIVLTGDDASLNFDDDSTVGLSAPTSGDTQGILFFQDKNFQNDHDWDGNSTTDLKGVIYLPTGKLTADSANQITPQDSCTVIIVWDLEVINFTSISVDFSSSSCRNSLPASYRRDVVLLQ